MKTLRNDEQRKLYLQNPNNWISIYEHNPIKISKLKNTPFIKLEVWTASGWDTVTYYKDDDCKTISRDKVSDMHFSRVTIKHTEMLHFLKKHKI